MVTRILLLLSLAWLARLTAPLFTVAGHAFSGRDLILLIEGLFLLAKSTFEIHEKLEGRRATPRPGCPPASGPSSPRSCCWTWCSRWTRSSRRWAWPIRSP